MDASPFFSLVAIEASSQRNKCIAKDEISLATTQEAEKQLRSRARQD